MRPSLLLHRNVLTLYSKTGNCSLCVQAKEAIRRVNSTMDFEFQEVDITAPGNEEFRKYRYDIPVVHFNGQFLTQHRVEETALRNLLRKRMEESEEVESSQSGSLSMA